MGRRILIHVVANSLAIKYKPRQDHCPISASLYLCYCSPAFPDTSRRTKHNDNKIRQNHTLHSNASESQELVQHLTALLQKGQNCNALRLIHSLLLSNSTFHSPSHLFEVFIKSTSPSSYLNSCFSDMLLCVCLETNRLDEAIKVIGLMKTDGLVLYTASINRFLERLLTMNRFENVLKLYKEILETDVRQDSFTYAKAVQAAVKLGDWNRVFQLWCFMEKGGVSPTTFVYNVVMGGLCRAKRTRDVQILFDGMSERKLWPNLVTYNTLMDGYCKVGELERACGLLERIKAEKLHPNLVTYNSLLSGFCQSLRMEGAKKVLQEMEDNKFVPGGLTYYVFDCQLSSENQEIALQNCERMDNHTFAILLDGLCKGGKIEEAESILYKLIKTGFHPNEIVYNTLINGFCQSGDINQAVSRVQEMESLGLKPSSVTFNTLINKFCEKSEMDEAERWVRKMTEKGVRPNVETYNILINCYGRMCDFDRCFQILEQMEDRGVKPNVVSYGSLINCLCKDGKLMEAEVILGDMLGRGILPNAEIYNMLIDGFCTAGKLKAAFRILNEMVSTRIKPTLVTYNALMYGLCKNGRVNEAEDLVLEIKGTGYNPDVITYNSLISGYANQGNTQKCLELYNAMKELGIKPTLRTFHPLICACSEEELVTMETLFDEMLRMDMHPDIIVYNAMIYAFAEHGDVEKVLALFNQMTGRGIHPDKATYNSLILVHIRGERLSEVKNLVVDMKSKGLSPKADTYTLLIMGHCSLNDFDRAYLWYKEMLENGLFLNPRMTDELILGLRNEGRLQEAELISSEINSRGLDRV